MCAAEPERTDSSAPPARIRVLAVMPGITPDAGAEQSLAAVMPTLVEQGVDLHLALLTERQSLAPAIVAAGGVVHDLSASRSTWQRVRALRRLERELAPDVVHATLYEATLPAQIASIGRRHRPTLVTWANTLYSSEHMASINAAAYKIRLVQLSEILLARLASTRFHAVTSGVGRVNAPNLLVRSDRVLVGERGRDPLRYERTVAAEQAVAAVRAELNPSGDHRFVLAVGRQDLPKGQDLLLAAFDDLADGRPDVELIIAGREGSATTRLRQVHAQMRHGDRVTFLGHRDDTAALMWFADVVVCSSLHEGAAGALIEAMACERPIVSVPLTGLEDVLDDDVNALIAPHSELAAALGRILDDGELAARLAAAGRRTFDERFTIQRSGERLASIYRQVAGR